MNKNYYIFSAIVITIVGFSLLSRINISPNTEEILFVSACDTISETWTPIYDNYNKKNLTTLWHPPLYQYLMSFQIFLFKWRLI